ncbi:MAG: DNA-directed RNA polymerase subunit alpha [Chthonomonadales bacterium]
MELTEPRITTLEESATYGKFVVEPLDRGYGVTLGNSLRRVLLSSIEGAAITYVKIDKVLHEFSTIPGVKEDTTELLLNLKGLYVKVHGKWAARSEPFTLRIARRGEGRVTGADVECPAGIEVVNPEAYIATIADDDASLNIEMTVEIGKGYVLPDKQERRDNQPIGIIPVGSAFTPVRKVNYTVEATRVGFKTDYERLTLEITTNGTISPSEAMSEAASILMQQLEMFVDYKGTRPVTLLEAGDLSAGRHPEAPDARIDELEFSVRTLNCLKKAGIVTVRDLVQTSEADLMQIRNFGRKSLEEVRERLAHLGLSLKGGPALTTDDDEEDLAEEAGMEGDTGEEEVPATSIEKRAPAEQEEV